MLVIGYNAVRDFRVENAYLEHPFFRQLGGCFTYHSPSTLGCIVSTSHHPLSFFGSYWIRRFFFACLSICSDRRDNQVSL